MVNLRWSRIYCDSRIIGSLQRIIFAKRIVKAHMFQNKSMSFLRAIFLLALFALSACSTAEPIWAPDDFVERQTYKDDSPTSITLYTVISNQSGFGGHSALLINAPSQRVMFDPAGTFKHPHLPERNDVLFGMSDLAVDVYVDYHTRATWHVVEQKLNVDPQTANIILNKALNHGAASKALCGASVSSILASTPGFESLSKTYFPKSIMKWMAKQPGVRTERYFSDRVENIGATIKVPALLLPVANQ